MKQCEENLWALLAQSLSMTSTYWSSYRLLGAVSICYTDTRWVLLPMSLTEFSVVGLKSSWWPDEVMFDPRGSISYQMNKRIKGMQVRSRSNGHRFTAMGKWSKVIPTAWRQSMCKKKQVKDHAGWRWSDDYRYIAMARCMKVILHDLVTKVGPDKRAAQTS